jgi:hypothetical protein
MKKMIVTVVIMIALHSINFGQDVFRTGKNGIHLGGGYRNLGIAAFGADLSFERSIYKIPDIGYLGIGINGEVIFSESELTPIGSLRAIYHAGFYRSRVLDVYSGLGICIAPTVKPVVIPDIFIGFRYLPKHSKIGFFGEAAYYGTNLKLGVCFIF